MEAPALQEAQEVVTRDDSIAQRQAALIDWLRRTNRMAALSGDGLLKISAMAECLGVSMTTARRMVEERTPPLKFRRVGSGHGRWKVELTSLAAYLANRD